MLPNGWSTHDRLQHHSYKKWETLTEKAIGTPTPAQTTSDTWLGFFMRDGEEATIKGRNANDNFLQVCLLSLNEVEGNWYPIRTITCVDPEPDSWEEYYNS